MHINDKFKNNGKVDYLKEYEKLQKIYKEIQRGSFGNEISLRAAFLGLFMHYEKRGTYIDYNEFERQFIPSTKLKTSEDMSSFERCIEYDEFLIYIEFLLEVSAFLGKMSNVKTSDHRVEENWKNIKGQLYFLETQIDNLMELMQCEIKEIDGFKNIVKKEEVANVENAFDNRNRPIKNKFYEYIQTSNRTNLDRKREILSSISNDWDGIKNSIKNDNIRKQVIGDLNFLLNNFNIRHNNNDNDKIAKIPDKKLIEIYDVVYKYFLYAYTIFNIQELSSEVEAIKKKYSFK